MSQCGTSSCALPQTGGACPCQFRNTLKGGSNKRNTRKARKTNKKRVRFTNYAMVCTCRPRKHRRTHKKLPKNCKK